MLKSLTMRRVAGWSAASWAAPALVAILGPSTVLLRVNVPVREESGLERDYSKGGHGGASTRRHGAHGDARRRSRPDEKAGLAPAMACRWPALRGGLRSANASTVGSTGVCVCGSQTTSPPWARPNP